jgi:cation/acetate symporter
MSRAVPEVAPSRRETNAAFRRQLHKVYGWYTGGFFVFVVLLAMAEQLGLARSAIGLIFLLATVRCTPASAS